MTEKSSPSEENIFEFNFQSHLMLQEILKKLQLKQFSGFDWSSRESEYDGVYIVGRKKITENHEIKLRIINYTQEEHKKMSFNYSLEVYFPIDTQLQSIITSDEKQNFLKKTVPEIIKNINEENL